MTSHGRVTPSDVDIDPYDLTAEDGAPGQTRNSGGYSGYSHINTRGAAAAQGSRSAGGPVEGDDYSHIDSPHSAPRPDNAGVDSQAREEGKSPVQPNPLDVYSVVNKTGKETTPTTTTRPNTEDDYSVVNKTGKKTTPTARPNPDDAYSLASESGKAPPTQPNPPDVYSVVNKVGNKPKVAAKPGQQEGGRNATTKPAGNKPAVPAKPRDVTGDSSNTVGTVPSPGEASNGGMAATPAGGDLAPDDYNTLSFDGARKGSAEPEERGTTRKAYDHVQSDPADPYSKTQIGKRNVVIDSDYDHVKNLNDETK